MALNYKLNKRSLVQLCCLSLFLMAAIVPAAGQTGKRKKPVPQPTITLPPSSEPAVISRADDFPNPGQQVLPGVEQASVPPAANADSGRSMEELQARIKNLETSARKDPDAKQKRLLLNLDILTRAEQRSDSLRKQLFEMIDKENSIKSRLDSIDYDLRPESIDQTTGLIGSLRPEELRNARRKSLESERINLQNLLTEIQRAKTGLEQNLQKSDLLVEKLRNSLEKEIEAALDEGTSKP